MNTEGFEQLFKVNKNFINPFGEWNKASTELLRKITQQNLELIEDNFSRVSDQFKRLSSIKKPEDIVNLHKECLNEDITAAIENMQKIIHNATEDMEELTKLCTNVRETALSTAKDVKEKVEKTVEKVAEKEKLK